MWALVWAHTPSMRIVMNLAHCHSADACIRLLMILRLDYPNSSIAVGPPQLAFRSNPC